MALPRRSTAGFQLPHAAGRSISLSSKPYRVDAPIPGDNLNHVVLVLIRSSIDQGGFLAVSRKTALSVN